MEFYRSLGHIAHAYLDHYALQRGHTRPLTREQLTHAQDLIRDLLAGAETQRLIQYETSDGNHWFETTPTDYACATADYWKDIWDKDRLDIHDVDHLV